MKHGFELKAQPLGDTIEIIMGQAPPSKECNRDGKGVPFVKVGEFTELYPEIREWTTSPLKLATKNDVLLCVVGATIGKLNYGIDCAIGRSVAAIRPIKTKLQQRYLFYFLSGLTDYLRSTSQGAAQTVITKVMISEIEIPLPPLPEQQRIVTILDEAFAAISKAKANAEQNLKNAKELFESYLQGVFENGKEIWEEKKLDEVCEFRNGAAHEQHIDEDGKFILVNSKFISADGEKIKRTNSALAPLFTNDIAFVMSDVPNGKALAKCFLVDENDTYTLNQRIGAIRSKVFVPKFFVYQFNRNKYLLSFNNGENQTNLRKGDIMKCPLWVPSKKEQQTIVSQLDALRAETQKLEAVYQKKMEDFEELKKSILQKAFAGELRSPEGAENDNEVATPLADDNDGQTPSDQKKKSITSPEEA